MEDDPLLTYSYDFEFFLQCSECHETYLKNNAAIVVRRIKHVMQMCNYSELLLNVMKMEVSASPSSRPPVVLQYMITSRVMASAS